MSTKLKIRQTRSAIGRGMKQKKTVRALGLRRLHQVVVHNDSPQVRGMIAKVSHLLEVEEISE
jgi:large subunit ribosomal protein L30